MSEKPKVLYMGVHFEDASCKKINDVVVQPTAAFVDRPGTFLATFQLALDNAGDEATFDYQITGQYNAAVQPFVDAFRDSDVPSVGLHASSVDANGNISEDAKRDLITDYNYNSASATGGARVRKTAEKVTVAGRERVVYKAGNKKYVKMQGRYASLTDVRRASAKQAGGRKKRA